MNHLCVIFYFNPFSVLFPPVGTCYSIYSDLPILFSYDSGVTISKTGINLFLDKVERVNTVDKKTSKGLIGHLYIIQHRCAVNNNTTLL